MNAKNVVFRDYAKIEISGQPDKDGIEHINKLRHNQTPLKAADLVMVVWAVEHGYYIPLLAYDHDNNRVFAAETIIGAATRANGHVQEALIQMYDSAARLIGAAKVLERNETESAEGS